MKTTILSLLFFFCLVTGPARAGVSFSKAINAPSDARYKLDAGVLDDVARAKAILRAGSGGQLLGKKVSVTDAKGRVRTVSVSKVECFDVLLAVKRTDSSMIEVIRFDRVTRRVTPAGFDLYWIKFNGVNTPILVSSPKNYIVLAMKRVVGGGKKGPFREEVYSSFNSDLDLPAVRRRGYGYLERVILEARLELEKKKVSSRAFPGKLVSSVAPFDDAFRLALIEHIDPSRLATESIDMLVSEVLVVLALNQGEAYKYSVSKASARGLFQFIPATYERMRAWYPGAGLDKDFKSGMADHVNAAKAALLLFDADLSHFPKKERGALYTAAERLGAYLAAAYNGGANRARRAFGGLYVELHHLHPETQWYMEKFYLTKELLAGI